MVKVTEELKPCPFCGAFGSLYDSPDHSTAWEGGCSNDKCPAWDVIWEETRAAAIAAWNRRAPDAALIAENEHILAGSRDNKLHFDVLKADYDALIAAGDRLAWFAGHDDGCALGLHGPACSCGYTEAWKKWKEVRGDDV